MKKLFFAVLALMAPAMSQAQLKVDSLGKTFLGQIPQEQFKKLTDATTTIFDNSTSSTLNLYSIDSKILNLDAGAPYFIQGVSGSHNGAYSFFEKGFSRVFYVDTKGTIYAANGSIQKAVDPSHIEIAPTSKATNFHGAKSALSRLQGISSVSYQENRVSGNARTMNQDSRNRNRLGLLASEVESSIPEAVVTLSDSTKCIRYADIVTVLIDAVNELNSEVASLKAQIKNMNVERNQIKQKNNATSDMDVTESYLSANVPNPFSENTTIGYYISENAVQASIRVYNLKGEQIRFYPITDTHGEISIEASELPEGMYIYTLYIDGVETESHKMILKR